MQMPLIELFFNHRDTEDSEEKREVFFILMSIE